MTMPPRQGTPWRFMTPPSFADGTDPGFTDEELRAIEDSTAFPGWVITIARPGGDLIYSGPTPIPEEVSDLVRADPMNEVGAFQVRLDPIPNPEGQTTDPG